jgi:hypothetical protein
VGIVAQVMSEEGAYARGADRFLWATLQPSETGCIYVLQSGAVVAMSQNPATFGGVATWTALDGVFMLRTVAGGWAHFASGAGGGVITPSISPVSPLSAPAPVAYPTLREVLVFREEIKWTANSVAAPNNFYGSFHGFTCQTNTAYTGIPAAIFGANVAALIGLGWIVNTGTWELIVKRNGVLATKIPLLITQYDGAQWALVEHRLYAPTTSDIGRYEFWVNQSLVATVLGTHVNFPHPTAAAQKYGAMPWFSETGAGFAGGLRVRKSELFTCANTDAGLSY